MLPQGKLLKMPGDGCFFFRQGHCILEEMRNPGYHKGVRCTVLEHLKKRFSDFVHRADMFGLETRTAALIWPRLRAKALQDDLCSHVSSTFPDFPKGCPCLYDNACVLLLPECPGRCSHFALPQAGTNHWNPEL